MNEAKSSFRDHDSTDAPSPRGRVEGEDDDEEGYEARGSEGQSEAELGDGELGELDDEALARRIFLDEQLAHQRRLMAIAGNMQAGTQT